MRPTYPDELRDLAQRLAIAAGTARSRRIHGLEDALTVAAESARSWAASLEDAAVESARSLTASED